MIAYYPHQKVTLLTTMLTILLINYVNVIWYGTKANYYLQAFLLRARSRYDSVVTVVDSSNSTLIAAMT